MAYLQMIFWWHLIHIRRIRIRAILTPWNTIADFSTKHIAGWWFQSNRTCLKKQMLIMLIFLGMCCENTILDGIIIYLPLEFHNWDHPHLPCGRRGCLHQQRGHRSGRGWCRWGQWEDWSRDFRSLRWRPQRRYAPQPGMKKNDEQFWCSNWVVTGISPKLNYIYIVWGILSIVVYDNIYRYDYIRLRCMVLYWIAIKHVFVYWIKHVSNHTVIFLGLLKYIILSYIIHCILYYHYISLHYIALHYFIEVHYAILSYIGLYDIGFDSKKHIYHMMLYCIISHHHDCTWCWGDGE